MTAGAFFSFAHLVIPRWFQQPAEGVLDLVGLLAGDVHGTVHRAQLFSRNARVVVRGGVGVPF